MTGSSPRWRCTRCGQLATKVVCPSAPAVAELPSGAARTGGVSTRVLPERGRTGIEELSRLMILILSRTILELTAGSGWFWPGIRYHAMPLSVALMTTGLLIYNLLRDEMADGDSPPDEESDTDANYQGDRGGGGGGGGFRFLNSRTGKIFRRQAARDRALTIARWPRYEKSLDGQTYTSLAVLNGGQAIIFTIGNGDDG